MIKVYKSKDGSLVAFSDNIKSPEWYVFDETLTLEDVFKKIKDDEYKANLVTNSQK